ncbi:hypothetical protein [Mycolicibacterium sarraceniae]|uniref:Uncharacterized protein n=1 Tax=Mycolicibacterium sarraceniae TaxID=1534348 RepID=A0A7I7SPG2_9MYCO|nr:hypothetical protein [Mycolicibacterium sarraceniae]BBY57726.1 hypothetical protein MSAR_08620 [Mycolicibacterium sarraceniae]
MFALVETVGARSSLVVKTTKNAALTAPLSIDPGDWLDGFGALMDRVRPRFVRCEPARHAAGLMLGLMSNLERENCWTIAEERGDGTPYGVAAHAFACLVG